MALTYDQISAITQKKFVPKMVDNIFDSNPLLQRAKKKFYTKIDGGTSIMQPLGYAQVSSAGSYSGADTLSTTDNDIITAAEYQWKQYYANISINRRDELMNNGDSAILKLVKQKTQTAEKTMADILGTDLWNAGTAAKSIGGLRLLFSASNTFGGIAQATYSWWQPQIDTSTTTLTLGAMQTIHNRCSIGSDGPTVAVTTRAIYNSYYGLLQPQQRFTDSETAKGGFSALMFNGIPIIVDSHAPTSHLAMLNEQYLDLFYHPDEDFRFEPFQKPINQNVKVAKVYWAGNFGTSNARMQGCLTALTA